MGKGDFNKNNVGNLRDWKTGDPLAAKHWQEVVQALKNMVGVGQGKQILNPTSQHQVKMFKVVDVDVDFINCHTFDGVTEGTDTIKVALPFLIRKTPFDSATRTDPPRAEITYVYTSNIRRTATKTVDGEEVEEFQIIVDSYEEGDIIFASKGIFGNTGVYQDDPTNEKPIIWLDENRDGRYWAATTEEEAV
jgi:hypothetical protein